MERFLWQNWNRLYAYKSRRASNNFFCFISNSDLLETLKNNIVLTMVDFEVFFVNLTVGYQHYFSRPFLYLLLP